MSLNLIDDVSEMVKKMTVFELHLMNMDIIKGRGKYTV